MSGVHAFIGGKGPVEKVEGGGGCRLEGEAPEGLHSIRNTLNGFLRGKSWGRAEEIDGYMSHILLLAEQ